MKSAFASIILFLSASGGHAHPVAQGAIELTISEGKIELRARVSPEEVLVANMSAQSAAADLNEVYERHGDYLLQHLRIFADDQRLLGKRAGTVMPQAGSQAARA